MPNQRQNSKPKDSAPSANDELRWKNELIRGRHSELDALDTSGLPLPGPGAAAASFRDQAQASREQNLQRHAQDLQDRNIGKDMREDQGSIDGRPLAGSNSPGSFSGGGPRPFPGGSNVPGGLGGGGRPLGGSNVPGGLGGGEKGQLKGEIGSPLSMGGMKGGGGGGIGGGKGGGGGIGGGKGMGSAVGKAGGAKGKAAMAAANALKQSGGSPIKAGKAMLKDKKLRWQAIEKVLLGGNVYVLAAIVILSVPLIFGWWLFLYMMGAGPVSGKEWVVLVTAVACFAYLAFSSWLTYQIWTCLLWPLCMAETAYNIVAG